jgi:D-alanyl-D-alanine carboxypeptidase
MIADPATHEQACHGLEGCLERLLARPDVAHATFAVRSGDGSFAWRGARGDARPDGTPMTVDTPYFVASVDKLVTATATFLLAERGSLDLDGSMLDYLPAELGARLHVMGGTDRSERITLRHLLSHTSGLADYLEDRPKGGRSLVEETLAKGDVGWTREAAFARVREQLRPHFPPQDLSRPNARAQYCDTNYLALKTILEVVEGRSVAEVYRSLVFEPLRMDGTWLASHDDPQRERISAAATLWAGTEPFDAPATLRSTHAMYSTLDDQLALLRGLVEGQLFGGDPGAFERMAGPSRRFGQGFDPAALRRPGWPIAYGHGVMRFELPWLLAPVNRPPAVVGHTGSTGSWAFHCPSLDVDLVGTVDQVNAGPLPFRSVGRWLRALVPLA